ncbi:MAG: B12-binding domain-containing radical SAM protein [Candidatus Omnitrophica bacterium]|nr:B12-binding domain-containing radical SAM protein [Candidatus Omnitrophota bacterium]
MNVTLIYPLLSRRRVMVDENKQFWPPLGLAYLAAVLEKHGHNVEILDRDVLLRKNGMDFEKLDELTLARIRDFRSGIVGISVTTPNMPDTAHLADRIKASLPGTMVVLGGPHVTGEPYLTLKEVPSADICVRGEGEQTLLDLALGKELKNTDGITFRKGEEIISTPERIPVGNLDDIPFPARHILDMKFYTRPSRFTSRNLNLRTTSIFTARGCPYRCSFCAGPLVFSGKVRFHSTGRVISEIEELIGKYDVEALYFAEDMFLASKKRAEELLNLFIEKGINRKIKWIAQAKASVITKEFLELMKEAGCVGIEYGFESGSQRVLDLMNKRQVVGESLRAAELTRKARLRFQANIITGYPGERVDDFKETLRFIKKVRPNMVGFNIFMPLPGTPSYEELKRDGKPLPRWEDVGDQEASYANYADMPTGMFEKLYLEARLKVILPINLRNFIKDNAAHPVRLIKIGLTQFGGVLVKIFRMARRVSLLGKNMEKAA